MTPAQRIINEVAKKHHVNPARVVGRDRLQDVVLVRLLVARRLRERGYSLPRIGAALRRHHTTVLYYLRECTLDERLERKRKPLIPWHTPMIGELAMPPKPPVRRCLVPYVGAKREYRYVMKLYQGASR